MQVSTVFAVHPKKAVFLSGCPFLLASWILALCLAVPPLSAVPANSKAQETKQKEKIKTSLQKKSDPLLPLSNRWQGDLLSLLSTERYKALDRIEKGQAIESPSLAAQKFFLGLRLMGERKAETQRQPNFIYGLEAALLGNLGSSSAIRKDASLGTEKGFTWLPADRLFVGLALPLQDSLHSRILLGRYRQPSLQAKLLGDAGSLTGLFWEFQAANFGRLRLILHKPVLAGDFLQKDGTIYDWSWQERLELERQRQTSLGQRLEWDFQYKHFFVGFYSDLQRHSIEREALLAASADASEKEDSHPSGTENPNARQAGLLLRYTGFGLGFSNSSGLRPASFGQEMPLAESRFLYEAYVAVERLDGSLPSLLKNSEGKYQRSLRAHVLRSGLGFALHSWFLQSDFFLPTSARRPQGSKPQDFEESGYIGFGKNPARGALLRNTLDARPFYGLCFALPGAKQEGCDGIERETSEWQIRRPSAIWNLKAGYRGEKILLALGASLFYPLALLESHPGSSPFQKLKKDSQQFSYREIGLEFRYQIQDKGFVHFRYNRLYRIRPANPESPLRKFQNRRSSLAAEFFEIEFSRNLF